MLRKKLIGMMALTLLSLPVVSQADSLTVHNNTNFDSTSIINKTVCSNMMGSIGVTKAHSTNVIPGNRISLACALHANNCKADVYMTDNCSGPVIATVILDIKKGIQSVSIKDPSYSIEANGFTVSLNGGPQ